MRTLLGLLLLALTPLAHAQRGADTLDKGWDPELGELELTIHYDDNRPRGRSAPAEIVLRTQSRAMASARRVEVAFNGDRRSLTALTRGERGTFAASAGVPILREIRSIGITIDDRQVLVPIPALHESEDGIRLGTYGDESSGFWAVIKLGTANPPPWLVVVIGTPPEDVVVPGSGGGDESGEDEDSGQGDGSVEGNGGNGGQGNNM